MGFLGNKKRGSAKVGRYSWLFEDQPCTHGLGPAILHEAYKTLYAKTSPVDDEPIAAIDEYDLPMIDIGLLGHGGAESEECKADMAKAAREWGFFQVVNHGVSHELIEKVRSEQESSFKQPFDHKYRRFSAGSYRWGTPTATCLRQFAWSEAFHIPLDSILGSNSNLSATMEKFASKVSNLAVTLAGILAEQLGQRSSFIKENCLASTCYLRMNRYPPCPVPSELFGLMPHTDSDFLTVLLQYQIGGLQLVKDGRWIAVKPNPDALIVNIGDMFQAWSNNVYKSVEHRVVTNTKVERLSTAYFLCPSYDTVIESRFEPSVYRKFSFREYRQKVQEDVTNFGFKIGLPRFLLTPY